MTGETKECSTDVDHESIQDTRRTMHTHRLTQTRWLQEQMHATLVIIKSTLYTLMTSLEGRWWANEG